MNQNIKKWVALIVVAIIALSGIYFFFIKGENTGAAGDINTVLVKFVAGLKVGKPNANGIFPYSLNADGTITAATTTVNSQGTVTYYTQGGIDFAYSQVAMTATSSVVCAMPNPFAATSTVVFPAMVQVTSNGIAQANNLFLSTSTTNAASSTNAWTGALAVAGSAQVTYAFNGNSATTSLSTSPAGTGDANILPGRNSVGASHYTVGGSEFLNWKIGTSTAGTFTNYYTGTCSALFMKP